MKPAVTQLDPIAAQLERASADWTDGDDLVLATALAYGAAGLSR